MVFAYNPHWYARWGYFLGAHTKRVRVPEECQGIQVNHCKNLRCGNFGIAAADAPSRGRRPLDNYVFGAKGELNSSLRCKLCGERSAVKSNVGIAEELDRLLSDLYPQREGDCCPSADCDNAKKSVQATPSEYYIHGKSAAGAKRYRCRRCGKTFSCKAKSTARQRKPEINEMIFRLLMNKMPMRRICETADIHPATLYGKIDFLHRQCIWFASRYEQMILRAPPVTRLYLSVDRQDYVFNWGTQLDRRNVMLHAIGTADNASGYVFGMHLDFDGSLDPEETERAAISEGDYEQQYPYRRYARLWLQRDYDDSHRLKKRLQAHRASGTMDGATAAAHRSKLEALQMVTEVLPDDIQLANEVKAPSVGMQVRAEYTMYAHFLYLRYLLQNVERLRFFMDQEGGIKGIFVASFREDILHRRVDGFLVRIRKDMSIDEKKNAKAVSEMLLAKTMRHYPEATRAQATEYVMRTLIRQAASETTEREFWVQHPFPDMGEPEKAVCYLTDFGDYDAGHMASLYLKASLRATDRFFMQVRRRMSIFERPISSASGRKTWHGYSAYNPAVGAKLLTIFRTFYNYTLTGEDKKTPAMRLGLMSSPVRLTDIIECQPDEELASPNR